MMNRLFTKKMAPFIVLIGMVVFCSFFLFYGIRNYNEQVRKTELHMKEIAKLELIKLTEYKRKMDQITQIKKFGILNNTCVLTNFACDDQLSVHGLLKPSKLTTDCVTIYTSSYGRGLYSFKQTYHEIPPPGNILCHLNKCHPIFSKLDFYALNCTQTLRNFHAIFTDEQLTMV